ncbi:Hypothetical predicted protein [Paramuricea clavata]|uniref:Uncharacterized protein n=1 Tax=Paramuricea clavata TaxID=317549 RepID=A0A6S7ILJ4_PARCT|nr:Hypothetical predicted protein [Paramuricea clavata]
MSRGRSLSFDDRFEKIKKEGFLSCQEFQGKSTQNQGREIRREHQDETRSGSD